jgi:tetratricopeptide (TPR) repeat protein
LRSFLLVLSLGGVVAAGASQAPGAQTGEGARGESRAHLARGSEHLRNEESREAVRELKSAVALDPRSAEAHMLLGQAYLALGAIELVAEAKGELQQALALDPSLVWARFYLAKIYVDLGRLERARRELEQALARKPDIPHLLALLGEVRRKLGDPPASIELNRRALALDPAMNAAHYHIGLALVDLGREDEAAAELESALRSKYVVPEIFFALGSLYLRRGEAARAVEVIRRGIALDPARPEGHLRVAQAYRAAGRDSDALAELDLALGRDAPPLSSPYYQQLRAEAHLEAGLAHEHRGAAVEAAAAYLRALDADPSLGKAHRQLAGLRFAEGDFVRALEHARRAAELGAAVDASLYERIVARAGRP